MDFIIIPFINVILYIYELLGAGVNDFGWAIVIFTIITRLALYPFSKKQIDSAKAMQDLQSSPEYQKMMKKYKDDKEKLAQEQMKLYQEKGISPFSSCLPTLLQLPIIIGIYQAVVRSLATSPLQLLNLASNLTIANASQLIPFQSKFLWMELSQPERWLGLSNIIPENFWLIGEGIPILAIFVFITSFLQSKLMTPPSTNPDDQSAAMGKMMNIYMPVLMAWISYSYSAGLAVYFVTTNVVSIVQYALMGRFDFKNLFGQKQKKA